MCRCIQDDFNYICKGKNTRIRKLTLKKKNIVIMLWFVRLTVKLQLLTVLFVEGLKHRLMEKVNPQNIVTQHGQFIFGKYVMRWRNNSLFNKWCWQFGHSYTKTTTKIKQIGRNFTLILTSYTKLKQNVSFKNLTSLKFTEENIEEKVYGLD